MKKRVAIFGGSLSSVNYGVTALLYTQIQVLQKVAQECGIELEYWIFSDETYSSIARAREVLGVNSIIAKNVIRIKTGIPGFIKMKKDIQNCDFIIDLTYGDSFADIYGEKSFWLYSVPKFLALANKQNLIFGPQTIGPFYKKHNRWAATSILKKAKFIAVRDRMSLDEEKKLSGRNDVVLTSDLAMDLPYDRTKYSPRIANKLNIGLNVSGLMWVNNSNNSNLNVKLSYQDLIFELIKKLIEREVAIHLITHVYVDGEKSEYDLSKRIQEKYPQIIVAPRFTDPVDAKCYISNMDLFIGARMHATIAAFSSGVPVIPISYSRKFEGLYGTIGYDHVINCSENTVESAVDSIMWKVDHLKKLKEDVDVAFAKAEEMNRTYYNFLKGLLSAE
ncbi:polysaccharide pyruvyl transferase family protein [Lachnospiraceae bacterium 54-53]